MNKNKINANVLQELFDSASNAGAKGQAQYFTPADWAKVLSLPLNKHRPVVVDLTAGDGSLLRGARNYGGVKLLGCEIEPSEGSDFVTADITKFYPLLHAVNFAADCFVLNHPWDMHWYRDSLMKLAESYVPGVPLAFLEEDGRTGADTIDSGVATLCMALDLSSRYAEGLQVWNEATLQRLILNEDAPHHALAEHIWAHLVIEGNVCQPSARPGDFKTGIIYFAREHTFGPYEHNVVIDGIKHAEEVCQWLQKHRLELRKGARAMDGIEAEDTATRWKAAAEEWARLNPTASTVSDYNLYLECGRIRTRLSLFDNYSGRVDNQLASRLHALEGKLPMQLVVQVAHRRALEEACLGKTPWRVDPVLQKAVTDAVGDYNKARAPLYPLPEIKRLGYLDEQDSIECKKDLTNGLGDICFKAGQAYQLRSLTVQVNRTGTKLNLHGFVDRMEWNGSELGFFIKDDAGMERLFMEGRLRDPSIKVTMSIAAGAKDIAEKVGADSSVLCAIDFTLQELVDHFTIPDVPDVATLDPEGYQRNLKLMEEIEALCT